MAKVSRGMLKSLVKECLFEILLEASDESASPLTEARSQPKKSRKRTPRPALDSISYAPQKSAPTIDTSGITSDPVMSAIFEDTARTTLREQNSAERGKMPSARGDAATRMAGDSDPTELFGESAQNWAALAFAENMKS